MLFIVDFWSRGYHTYIIYTVYIMDFAFGPYNLVRKYLQLLGLHELWRMDP